ncbi:ShlB/FhaC/HecB family hemolysin secretion/activation protein [Providencia huaxiensis]|uniref:ShlB/FhaC/HecB family hemolysin secretion/activation protein n=1 Tax=Providencia TaxID=586 RepID=UPI0021F5C183|nr:MULTISPECIES: ShlB/FhaC/HecB family hemolysin secretion/activation protein [Providencia]
MQFNASVSIPFTLAEQSLRFDTQYSRQISDRPLTPQDQFSIGNRWTVRGFDGERTLSADEGWTLRNTLLWSLPISAQELYVDADYGKISGRWADQNLGTHLAGGAIGLRGAIKASGQVYNTGLIDDGLLTHIVANSLDNLGTGRIYGDFLAIAVNSLVNDKQGEKAAVRRLYQRADDSS